MMEVRVSTRGAIEVLDYRINGNLHRTRTYDSWRSLLNEWGPRWSIDARRTVWVRPDAPRDRLFALLNMVDTLDYE